MSARPILLEFVPRRRHVTPAGALLLVVGLAAAAGVLVEHRAMEARQAGLALKLAETNRNAERAAPLSAAAEQRLLESGGRIVQQLGTPWTGLLAELEQASRASGGDVAVLGVEPDQDEHRVRIRGESRNLALALAYVERLQALHMLRHPMLDSHEVQTDDSEHPVRFAMSAEWVAQP